MHSNTPSKAEKRKGQGAHERVRERGQEQDLLADYASRPKAARMLHKHEFTLKRWARAGYGPQPVKVGGRLYYRISDIERWLESLGDSDSEGGV